jgi:hypothetical protein
VFDGLNIVKKLTSQVKENFPIQNYFSKKIIYQRKKFFSNYQNKVKSFNQSR